MGMPGMNIGEAKAYAAPAAAPAPERPRGRGVTVAELRNAINPMTGYYDWMDAASFMADSSIPDVRKLEAVFGRFVAEGLTANPELGKLAVKTMKEKLTGTEDR